MSIEILPNNAGSRRQIKDTAILIGWIASILIIAGILWAVIASRLPDNKPVFVYTDNMLQGNSAARQGASTQDRNRRRKLRNKLK